ncbi:MAG: hypothetical protein JST89_00630 [Cyanobacteria bacterium SZAS-4]|nr:hypothetical protein [Cyanobacteria bacterium SZAS-4]
MFTSFTQTTVAAAWGIALLVCAIAAAKSKNSLELPRLQLSPVVLAMAVLTLALGILAVYCSPNNYDSLTYHLSRIEHWINNRSVAHFQIHVLRQLTMNPAAEFLIMHLRLLSGTDYFSNVVQWFSMIGCLLGTSLLAKQLGANARAQVLAAAFCLTIPIGILESTSTQNDYVAALWFICFLLNLKNFDKSAVWCGLSLGLFALTKPTAYFFALPFLVLLSLAMFKRMGVAALRPLAVAAALSIMFCAPFAMRNTMMFGTPFVNKCNYGQGYRAGNDAYSLEYFASNVMRNAADELFTPIPICNKIIVGAIERVHSIFHWDASDPKSTFDGITFGVIHPAFQLQEDTAGNPLHTVLFLIAVCLVIGYKQTPERRTLLLYSASLMVGFFLFSAVLKWQPWHSRLLLPLYVAAAPIVGCAFNRFSGKLNTALISVLLIYSLPYLLLNPNKIVLGDENIFAASRDSNYFRSIPNYYASYVSAIDFLDKNHASRIGVVAEDTSWCEYPLWVLLSHNFTKPACIEGLSAPEWKEYRRTEPDALISFDRNPPDTISLPGKSYRRSLLCDSTGDRVYYHFYGHEIGKTYNHLSMAVYLPQSLSPGLSPSEQVSPR